MNNYVIPMLAKEFKKSYVLKYFNENKNVVLQPKLDGVRMIYDGNKKVDSSFYSRKLKPISCLLVDLKEECIDLFGSTPCDGEIYIRDINKIKDKDSMFKTIIQASRTHRDKSLENVKEILNNICFVVYDIPIPNKSFSERYEIIKEKLTKATYVKACESSTLNIKSKLKLEESEIKEYLNIYNKSYEGTMVRCPDSHYSFGGYSKTGKDKGNVSSSVGRSFHLLKIKEFKEDEAIVIGVERGVEDCRNQDRMGNLLCKWKDKIFSIGSGFSDEERELWFKNKNIILNKTITFKYQELSSNGVPRFATFKCIRDYE